MTLSAISASGGAGVYIAIVTFADGAGVQGGSFWAFKLSKEVAAR